MLYTWLAAERGGQIDYSAKTYHYMARMRIFYGDPALKLHLPHRPSQQPAHVEHRGNIVQVIGPQQWPNPYIGLGTYGEPFHPGNHLVRVTTQRPVKRIVEMTPLPDPRLGWPLADKADDTQRAWLLDANADGTFTVWWRCRFEQLQGTGRDAKLTHRIDRISYRLEYE
jgi:hypothetical protein